MFTLRRSPPWAACALAIFLSAVFSSGCIGYNRSAKRTAAVGDSLLILGGGAVIGAELLWGGEDSCNAANPNCRMSTQEDLGPVTGPLVAGTVLVTAGIVGLILNFTRPNVKTSR